MNVFNLIEPTTIVIGITFAVGFLFLKKQYFPNLLLLSVLLVSLTTEIIYVFLFENESKLLLYSISFIFHNSLWLLLILKVLKAKRKKFFLLWVFLFFSILNLFFFEGRALNHFTFIFGAIIYVTYFISKSISFLKKEELVIFSTNDFLLIFSPIMFFLGLSFTLGFGDKIRFIKIFNSVDLYTFIIDIVNCIYYGLLNIYIFKQRRYV